VRSDPPLRRDPAPPPVTRPASPSTRPGDAWNALRRQDPRELVRPEGEDRMVGGDLDGLHAQLHQPSRVASAAAESCPRCRGRRWWERRGVTGRAKAGSRLGHRRPALGALRGLEYTRRSTRVRPGTSEIVAPPAEWGTTTTGPSIPAIAPTTVSHSRRASRQDPLTAGRRRSRGGPAPPTRGSRAPTPRGFRIPREPGRTSSCRAPSRPAPQHHGR
jgi:hypothetical protein